MNHAPSEVLDREKLRQIQTGKLQALLRAMRGSNLFYSGKLAQMSETGLEPSSLESWLSSVPFTTKHELVKDRIENPPYGTDLTFPFEQYTRCHQTSGSTAVPLRWLDTPESWDHIVQNWMQILSAAGVSSRDRFLFAFSFGPFLGFWSAIEAVHRLGHFCFPAGGMSTVARIKAILDNEITVLCCTPTYSQHLGETAAQNGMDLACSRVRLIIVAGEAGGSIPATRARIERLWPAAKVFDHHGMTEVGPVTYQCPCQTGVLHVLETAYVAEVVDPKTGAVLPRGTIGELVLTTLDRTGSPLLRYRTGDLVQASTTPICKCGRHELALQGGIIGRADDMVVIRGVNVYPSLVEEIVRSHLEVLDYRVELDSRGPMLEMSLDFEPTSDCRDAVAVQKRLATQFQDTLNLRIPVRAVPSGSLPKYEMKARRWVKLTEGLLD